MNKSELELKYDNHIFISYAHKDNKGVMGGEEGWVSNLHHTLVNMLDTKLSGDVKVWFDPALRGNEDFSAELEERISTAATLVLVMSPSYMDSEWCQRELTGFINSVKQTEDLETGNKKRIFKVIKNHVPYHDHPQEIKKMLGYEFYDRDPNGRSKQYEWYGEEDLANKFRAKMGVLTDEISEMLKIIEIKEPPAQGPSVYLAQTHSNLNQDRDKLKSELKHQGFSILPDEILPTSGPELEKVVLDYLDQCKLSIHMVGENRDLIPESAEHTISRIQLDLAVDHSEESNLTSVIWLPEYLENFDDQQQEFLDYIYSAPKISEKIDIDIIQGSIENLKTEVIVKLNTPEIEEIEEKMDGHEHIYLICDESDLEPANKLKDELISLGFEVFLPDFEGTPEHVREAHEEYIQMCEGALIYYGKAKKLWVHQKLQDIDKSVATDDTPVRSRGIYMGEPQTEQKKMFSTNKAVVISRDSKEKLSKALKPFTDKLK